MSTQLGTLQADAPDANAGILAALDDLQQDKISSKARLGTLALSLVAFLISVWLIGFSTLDILIVVVVLFIHEAGHYAAMRRLGYRNVRMFFIPFLGAAVSGHNALAAPSKDALVSLLGPLPGLLIGYFLGLLYLIIGRSPLYEWARAFVVLNAVNLLPLFPLDGGQFVFTLLGNRHYRIRLSLQIIMVMLIFSAGFFVEGVDALGGLAIFCLLSTWQFFRVSRVANKLSGQLITATPTNSGAIPAEAARQIIARVKQELGLMGDKEIAQAVLQIWKMNARHPRWSEVYNLVLVYGLYLLSAGVAWLVHSMLIAR